MTRTRRIVNTLPPERRRLGCAFGWVVGVVILVSMVAATSAVLGAIWPGVYEFTAPLVCPDGHDEPVIVRDTTSVRPGETSTTFTMYCLNERGEAVDVGIWRPVFYVSLVIALVMLLAVAALVIRVGRRATRDRPPTDPPSQVFVDVRTVARTDRPAEDRIDDEPQG